MTAASARGLFRVTGNTPIVPATAEMFAAGEDGRAKPVDPNQLTFFGDEDDFQPMCGGCNRRALEAAA